LIVEKDKYMPKKKDRSNKRILNISLTVNSKGETIKHYIKPYAPACMHNNIAKPYDNF